MTSLARKILTEAIHPHPYDDFFEEIVGRQPLALVGEDRADRAQMLGNDPQRVILDEHAKFAPTLTCHAHSPSGPPPEARPVPDAESFHLLIREYHALGYTVRIPDVTDLSPALRQFTRALEIVFEAPVEAAIFWSEAGAAAPVHHDEHDIIAIQLFGQKKWFVSDDPPTLPNKWKRTGEGPPQLNRHSTPDVAPGDLLYLPRGTAHTVQSTTESIHLSIGFVPVTVRDAIIASLDHLSDLDRPLRTGITDRADGVSRGGGAVEIAGHIRAGVEKLVSNCQSDAFIQQAMELRKARMVFDLPELPSSNESNGITMDTVIRHSPLAMAQLIATPEVVDFSYPGGHILIHRGAEESLKFVSETPEFRVADIPGEIGDDVRVALTQKFLDCGVLEVADAS